MTRTDPATETEVVELKIKGAAREVVALASQSGWVLQPGFPRAVRPPGNLRRVTQLYFQHPDGSTLVLEYTRRGELVGHQTLSKNGRPALWYLHGGDELLDAVADRRAVRRAPDVRDERAMLEALHRSAAAGNRVAREVLRRAGDRSTVR